jgi:predicted dehydrogenase
MNSKDGMNYAPKGKPSPVVQSEDFAFAAVSLEHGHIYGMCNGLIEAGAKLKWVYDSDHEKVGKFLEQFPHTKVANSEEEIFNDAEIKLVAAAAIPHIRYELGMRVMHHGKDYFTDKTPFTSLEQLSRVREWVKTTGQKYMVYYSERLHNESAVFAGQLIEAGKIGRVIHVTGFGPHRLSAQHRPRWFFEKEKYGGILCDIGSHQIEQFLFYAQCKNAQITDSKVGNYHNPDYPELEDYGDANLVGDNGATNYFRVDWLTPHGLSTWGDGRTFILGTEGYIEMRKFIDIARGIGGDQVYLVDKEGEKHFSVQGQVGYPFFGQLILDCLHRTEFAMTQEHAFKAAELSLVAQERALKIKSHNTRR